MSDIALRMEHVYKKFRKGEVYNSLRDLAARSDRTECSGSRNSAKATRENSGPCRISRSR